MESGTVEVVDPSDPWYVETGTTGVVTPSVPVVNPTEGEVVGPPAIGLPSESVKAVIEDRGSIPEPDNEAMALDRPGTRG